MMRLRSPGLLWLVTLLWIAGAGCMQRQVMRGGQSVGIERAAQMDLAAARGAIEAGQDARAQQLLEGFLVEFRRGPGRDQARSLLAGVYARQGDLARSVRTWRELIDDDPRSPLAGEARLRGAQGYRELGRPEVARRFLQAGDLDRAPEALRPELYRLLADLSLELGDSLAAVRALASASSSLPDPAEREPIEREASRLVREQLSDRQLEELFSDLPQGPIAARTGLELARRQVASGQGAAALALLDRLPLGLGPEEAALALQLREQARSSAGAMARIGLALPLSGPFESFGRAALRGFALGLDLFGGPEPAPYRVVIRDTAAPPQELGGSAVQDLVREGVRAIVGPMRSSDATAASLTVQNARVPMITLARSEQLTREPSYVFRTATAQIEQARALADFAIETLEARRFAILYPRDRYGVDFKNFFWDEVERRGGKIVAVEGYPPDAVDIQDEIRKLVGLYYLTPDERARVAQRDRMVRRREQNAEKLLEPQYAELPPFIDFDAIFIPDVAANAGVVLPQLRFYDVRDVVLLGPSDWNDPVLAELAPQEAEDTVFVDAFYSASESPAVQEFVARYREAYGDAPDAYAAEGFDAAKLLSAMVRAGVPMVPEQLVRALRAAPPFPAAAGLSGFDEVGAPIKELYYLTVNRGRIREYVPGMRYRGGP